jgi:SAM-dependent methyltransferase
MALNSENLLGSFVCPQCKTALTDMDGVLVCEECIIQWSVRSGIPVFNKAGDISFNESHKEDLRLLIDTAESVGWEEALFDYTTERVIGGKTLLEDQRITDWRYLLPLNEDSVVLSIGCGLGTIPIALSAICAKVYAVESDWSKVFFLNVRKTQQRIDNLYPVYLSDDLGFPFPDKYFDFVVVRGFDWRRMQYFQVQDVIRTLSGLLNENGMAYLSFENRWAFNNLLDWKRKSGLSVHTAFGYRRILRSFGFSEIQFFAPLPHYDGIPLFYVPLEDPHALKYFLRSIFPLFEMASPEVKRNYAFEYIIAKVGVRLALQFGLVNYAKAFVPGYSIIARKTGQDMETGYAK